MQLPCEPGPNRWSPDARTAASGLSALQLVLSGALSMQLWHASCSPAVTTASCGPCTSLQPLFTVRQHHCGTEADGSSLKRCQSH